MMMMLCRLTEIMTILAAINDKAATIHGNLLAGCWKGGCDGFASGPANRSFFGLGLPYAVTQGLSWPASTFHRDWRVCWF